MRLQHCGMAGWSACAGKNFRSILLPRMHLVQNDIWCDSSLYTCVIVRVSFFAYLHTISMYITLSTHVSRFPDKTQREMASQSAAVWVKIQFPFYKFHYSDVSFFFSGRDPYPYAWRKFTIYGIFFQFGYFFLIWNHLRRAVKNRETKLNESSSSGKKKWKCVN